MPDPTSRLNTALEGRYFIERELGQGGMATVYLARDLRHNRNVALKVLKPELAAVVGAERFLAEIETTANLQHPHILPLFDSGEADGFLFYVMPFIEGETLQDRMDREKQLPVDEAVGIAIAVANALQTAHDQGVIHRDIKPANILLSRGEPLVADFGIALAVGAAGGNRLTETGLSVGTPYYMSPEQATGDQVIGPASDVYALASVLFEMLTGDPPFQGSTAQAVLGRILQGTAPSVTEVRRVVPAHVDGAIRKALEKLPADRFAGAKDFAAALSDPSFRYGEDAVVAAAAGRGWTRLTSVFAVSTLALAGATVWALVRAPADPVVNRFQVDIEGAVSRDADLGDRGRLALSADGRRLVFVGPGADRGRQLWLREFDQLEARPIPGTEGGSNPSLSPDGLHVAFTVGAVGGLELRRVPLDGGPSLLVSDSLIDAGGVSWGRDGYIYTDAGLEGDGFARVDENGGLPEIVTTPTEGENWHSVPNALPNGKGVLFYVEGPDRIDVVDVESGERTPLVEGVWGGYAGSGHLIWVTREGTLTAQPFDPESFELSGRPTPLVEGVLRHSSFGGANVALSDSGDLVYLTGDPGIAETTLAWVDRAGAVSEFDPEWVRPFRGLALSPDGRQVAVTLRESDEDHIWVKATAGGPARKLTFETSNQDPAWLPDGEWVGYVSARQSESGIYKRRADGTGGEVLVVARDAARRPSWSPDGRWLIYDAVGVVMGQPLGGDGEPDGDAVVLVDESAGFDGFATVSPDGRWIAFTSTRTGSPSVVVRPFPETEGGNWLITEGGSAAPSWSSDGTELHFRHGPALRSVGLVGVRAGRTFDHTSQETLFDAARLDLDGGEFGPFSLMPEGDRFLMIRSGAAVAGDQRLVLVQNFFEALRERLGN